MMKKAIGTILLTICCSHSAVAQGTASAPQDAGAVPPPIQEEARRVTMSPSCPPDGKLWDGHVTFFAKSSAAILYVSTTEFTPRVRETVVLDGHQRLVADNPGYSHEQGQWLLWFSLKNLSVGLGYQLQLKGLCTPSSGQVSYTAWLQ